MSKKPDPKKAIHLKPNQRTLPGRSRRRSSSEWVEHKGDSALDAWGVALRALKKLGVDLNGDDRS